MSLFMFTSLTDKSLSVCRVSCVGDGGYTFILVLNVASTITTERLSILVQAITGAGYYPACSLDNPPPQQTPSWLMILSSPGKP